MNNVLCLCPNDHVLFYFGAITITPERLTVTGDRATEGQQLLMARQHRLDLMNFDYHREAYHQVTVTPSVIRYGEAP